MIIYMQMGVNLTGNLLIIGIDWRTTKGYWRSNELNKFTLYKNMWYPTQPYPKLTFVINNLQLTVHWNYIYRFVCKKNWDLHHGCAAAKSAAAAWKGQFWSALILPLAFFISPVLLWQLLLHEVQNRFCTLLLFKKNTLFNFNMYGLTCKYSSCILQNYYSNLSYQIFSFRMAFFFFTV